MFEWTMECQAFTELRHILCTAPVLAFSDFTKPLIVGTDASNTGIGGVHRLMNRAKSISLLLPAALSANQNVDTA